MPSGKKLLIVESPAKAKTIGKYLGPQFQVKSSVGHVRDLAAGDGAIAIAGAGEGKWTFTPEYAISPAKRKVVAELRKAAKESAEIYLASDPDREGEAIAWHLKAVLDEAAAGKPFHRVTYNEITKSAVLKAVASPRDIDMPLVDAQQARRILDRLVGYKVSPLLWHSIHCSNSKQLSAGRVQSVALRLLVERQREIDSFKPETYWQMGVEAAKKDGAKFAAKLSKIDGDKPDLRDRVAVDGMLLDLADAELEVAAIKEQPKTRHPYPPFTTSTLQQAASSFLAFSPGRTMKLAQSLYEQGLITYMRTDSVAIADAARTAAAEFIKSKCGADYLPAKPNFYKSKAGAQGAHEAIRPTDVSALPAAAVSDPAERKLYDLIWRRFLASQMADAKTTVRTVVLKAVKTSIAHEYLWTASATSIDFDGFLKISGSAAQAKRAKPGDANAAADDGDDQDGDEVQNLPPLEKGERLAAERWLADEKKTKGPAYYSEASLVKALEENGVGRPSTYAATIETLKMREYAKNEKRKLVPLERGRLVSDWLTSRLDSLFSVGYTAQMEEGLDKVESGEVSKDEMLSAFYGKFERDLAHCAPAAADSARLEEAFSLLSRVKEWKPPVVSGNRTYDDKAFVESVRRQRDAGKAISERQLGFLMRMVKLYAAQIPGAAEKLREWEEAGRASGAAQETVDPALVKECFDAVSRIPSLSVNQFLKSLREQFDRGRTLSPRQLAILARTVGENCGVLENAEELRKKLEHVAGGFSNPSVSDPAAPDLLAAMQNVKEWREPVKRGRKTYDDRDFIKSLQTQYAQRKSLTEKQSGALRRVVRIYRDQIPGYAELAEKYALESGSGKRGGKRGDADGDAS